MLKGGGPGQVYLGGIYDDQKMVRTAMMNADPSIEAKGEEPLLGAGMVISRGLMAKMAERQANARRSWHRYLPDTHHHLACMRSH